MKSIIRKQASCALNICLFTLLILSPGVVLAQAGVLQSRNSNYSQPQYFSKDKLEELVAPIAIYPDPLLAQILPASTYPLEIVQAARLIQGKKDIYKIDSQDWDPSVQAVAHYPSVLKMMDEKLDWTEQLGQAVLMQQEEVMKAIQIMRQQAKRIGNLKSNKKQIINEYDEYIEIVPYNPEVVYVPSYDPEVVYVSPSEDPYVSLISFGVGLAIGSWFNTEVYWPSHQIYYCEPDWWVRGWYSTHNHHRYRQNYGEEDYNNNYYSNSNHDDHHPHNNNNAWFHDDKRGNPVNRKLYFMPSNNPSRTTVPNGNVVTPRSNGLNPVKGQPPATHTPERGSWNNSNRSPENTPKPAPKPIVIEPKRIDQPVNPRKLENAPAPQKTSTPPAPQKSSPPSPPAPVKVEKKAPEVKSAPAPAAKPPVKKEEEKKEVKTPTEPSVKANLK
ncbi:MAG: DUF3300 domain-containing protein [Deltaproteobacteria bacterium]|nr:DUF3300 domain-containing protein [Deltaproteobacteria bacterium]